jgi:hypothetical protein
LRTIHLAFLARELGDYHQAHFARDFKSVVGQRRAVDAGDDR